MTRFLRFVGMLNAGIWLGATLFFTLAASPALNSEATHSLLGQYFDRISGSLWQAMLSRLFYWHIVCGLIAALHLVAEWLYLGRTPNRLCRGLLAGLLMLSLSGAMLLPRELQELHRTLHTPNLKPEVRQAAEKSFRFWHGVFRAVNILMIGGIAVYFWRTANPPDELRFVGSAKFRG